MTPAPAQLAERVLATACDGIITTDAAHRIVAINPAGAALFGYSVADLLGQPLDRLLPESVRGVHTQQLAEFGASGTTRRGHGDLGMVHGLRADGSLVALEGSISRCEVDGATYYTVIHRPLTATTTPSPTVRRQLELERRLRDIAATAPGVVYSYRLRPDGTACLPYVSARAFDVLGLRPEQLADDAAPMHDRFHPDDRARVLATIATSAATLTPWRCELRFVHPERGAVWVEGHSVPVRDADGGTTWHGFINDVTERKNGEVALRAARDAALTAQIKLRAALEAGRIGTWDLDLATGVVHVDAIAAELVGRTPAELATVGDMLTVALPEDRPRVAAALASAQAGDFESLEARVLRRDGTIGTIIARGVVERDDRGQPRRVCGAVVDVTDARRAARLRAVRAEIHQVLAEARSLAEAGPALVAALASGTGSTACRLWQVDRSRDTLGRVASWPAGAEPDAAAAGALAHAAWAEGSVRCDDVRCALPVLHRREVIGVLELDGATHDADTTEFVRAVSERLGQFIAHRNAEERTHRILSLSPNAIYVVQLGTGQPYASWLSDNAAALLGWPLEESVTFAWWIARIHPDDQARIRAAHPRPYDLEQQVLEYRFRRKDGSYVWLRDEKRRVRDARGEPTGELIGTWSDVSERVQLEAQLRQAQKMEAIGVLAGGVAHDFNNLLTVFSCASDVLTGMIPPNDPRAELLDEITTACERGVALTRQLLLFSRTQVVTPRVLDPNPVLATAEKMLRRLIGEDVTLTTHLAPQIGAILIDPGQLEQIVLNLVVNARDAMPRGGALTITTARVELDADATRHPEALAGPHVRIAVTDTGSGIAPDVIARIFEPFFTTKPAGKGTGLGLATVFGIVQQAGGRVAVASQLGAGTTFTVDLPVVATATAATAAAAPARAPEGRERLLLVEDDHRVRRVTRLALEQHGYRVLEADCAEAALTTLDRERVDLVITDVVMPGGSGRDVAAGVEVRAPGTPVLFLSGYIDDAVMRHGIAEREAFLHKPVSPRVLLQKVRELLDGRRATRAVS